MNNAAKANGFAAGAATAAFEAYRSANEAEIDAEAAAYHTHTRDAANMPCREKNLRSSSAARIFSQWWLQPDFIRVRCLHHPSHSQCAPCLHVFRIYEDACDQALPHETEDGYVNHCDWRTTRFTAFAADTGQTDGFCTQVKCPVDQNIRAIHSELLILVSVLLGMLTFAMDTIMLSDKNAMKLYRENGSLHAPSLVYAEAYIESHRVGIPRHAQARFFLSIFLSLSHM